MNALEFTFEESIYGGDLAAIINYLATLEGISQKKVNDPGNPTYLAGISHIISQLASDNELQQKSHAAEEPQWRASAAFLQGGPL